MRPAVGRAVDLLLRGSGRRQLVAGNAGEGASGAEAVLVAAGAAAVADLLHARAQLL